jgi:Spy/CpxP family protein refolding chaperone
MKKRALTAATMCLFLSASAWSQPAGSGPRGGGYGMGPGMMGGAYGPGMMGGYGYGPGMMGGYGAGNCGPDIPDLTNEQRAKIAGIQKEFRAKQWALMEQMHEQSPFGGFYRDGKFDEQAARKAYDATANLHKQMFENSLEMQKRIDSVLSAKQREQLQRAPGGR